MRGLEHIPWIYDLGMGCLERFGLGRWRRLLVAGARGRVLELGCGTGRNLPLYGGAELLVAFDPHLDVLLAARRRAPGALILRCRAEALPFRPGSFDTVVSGLVFCSVDDVDRGLGEVTRVLAAGGELRMMEHVRHRHPGVGRVQDRIQPLWTLCTGGCRPNRDTEAAVAAAGFRIEGRRARGLMRLFSARRRHG